jgi:hypothetical protein
MKISAHLVHARALPEGLPADIQFMSPGEQTLTCNVGGKPKTFTTNITRDTATILERDRKRMAVAAGRNQGDLPYIDLNHNDEEAAGRVTEIYWAGDDPLTGGVRARVEWTAAGEAALRGKLYRRFSPSFLMDEAGNIVGLPNENLGGLVNRAAFKSIQPVIAKSAGLSELARTAGVSEDEPFFNRVAAVMEEQGINEKLAWAYVLKTEPELWQEHFYAMMGITPEQAAKLGIEQTLEATAACITPDNYATGINVLKSTLAMNTGIGIENHPFMVEARAVERRDGIDFVDASQKVAAKSTELYSLYCSAVRTAKPAVTKTKPSTAPAHDGINSHPFMAAVRALAKSENIDETEAASRVCARDGALYSSYCKAVSGR